MLHTVTFALQSSLTGNGARISVVCTVTPASSQAEETHNTLKFATRAKKIEITAQRNEIVDQASLIRRYQEEIQALRSQLEGVARERGGPLPLPAVVHDPLHPEVLFGIFVQSYELATCHHIQISSRFEATVTCLKLAQQYLCCLGPHAPTKIGCAHLAQRADALVSCARAHCLVVPCVQYMRCCIYLGCTHGCTCPLGQPIRGV